MVRMRTISNQSRCDERDPRTDTEPCSGACREAIELYAGALAPAAHAMSAGGEAEEDWAMAVTGKTWGLGLTENRDDAEAEAASA
jgi:hypothetical protein